MSLQAANEDCESKTTLASFLVACIFAVWGSLSCCVGIARISHVIAAFLARNVSVGVHLKRERCKATSSLF